MTISLERLLEVAVRNMKDGIHPVVKESALEMVKRAYEEEIYVQITSGFRSFTEQDKLFAQGRTTPGNIVTNARAGQSNHNYGLAIDYVLLNSEGTKAIWTVNEDWKRVASIGKALGFKWGGDWTSFKDYPHLEMMGGLTIRDLQNGRKPVLTSKVSGETVVVPDKPEVDSEFVERKDTGDKDVKRVQEFLNKEYKAKLNVDGYTGPLTDRTLLKALQKELNEQFNAKLVADGLYGPKTKDALVNVKEGARGNITKIAQAMLYCKDYNPKGLDGIFGAGMTKAVKAFQGEHKLSKDGIIGTSTWVKLIS